MTLRDLSEALAPLVATMHPLTPCNIDGLTVEGGDIVATCDTSAMQEQIDDLKTGEAALSVQVKELEEENASLELRAELAERLIDEVKHEDEKGQTLRHYVKEACDAGLSAERWKRGYVEMRSECEALRKRKGVTVHLFAAEREILELLGDAAQYSASDAMRIQAKARTLLTALHAK